MAHNARIRTVGTWTGVVTPTEWDTFDQRFFASINGDDGGVWAPSSAINFLGSQGITVSGPCHLRALHTLSGGAGSTFTLLAGSTMSIGGTLTFANGSILDGLNESTTTWGATSTMTFQSGSTSTFSASCTTTFGAPTKVSGTPTFQSGFAPTFQANSFFTTMSGSTWNVAGAFAHSGGTVTLKGAVSFTGSSNLTRSCVHTLSGAEATTRYRAGGHTSDSDSSYDASNDSYSVPALSAGRDYTLLHTSGTIPITGSRIRFVGLRGTNGPRFKREDATIILAEAGAANLTPPWWAEFTYYSGAWHCTGWHQDSAWVLD